MRYAHFAVMGGLQISYADIATDWGMFKGSPWERPHMSRLPWKRSGLGYEQLAENVKQWEEDQEHEWNARPYPYSAFNHAKPTKSLSSSGVLALAKLDEFIYISRETIQDKSKADAVQKAVVVIQVTWMVLQCLARKAYGPPLTLLEVHTMVHVMCAILFYSLWFRVKTPLQDNASASS